MRLDYLPIVAIVALACAMALTAIAEASALTLTDRIVAVQPMLASKTDEPVDPLELASAITAVPKISADWAALLLTVAGHESALSARIAANQCHAHECDHGRAAGLYQAHKNALNAEVWGSPDIRVQTLEAARALRSAFYTCGAVTNGALRPDWLARTINGYAGRRCDALWPGLATRLATFRRVRARL